MYNLENSAKNKLFFSNFVAIKRLDLVREQRSKKEVVEKKEDKNSKEKTANFLILLF